MPEQNYLKRAWKDLTSSKGWYKPLLILGLVMCIPIIGPITTQGYLLDWAKEAAWGMNRGLSHKVGSISRRMRYGLITLVIYIVWLIPVAIIIALLMLIPQAEFFIQCICTILKILVCTVATIAALRGLVYERIEPGLQFGRVLKMIAHDTKHLLMSVLVIAIVFLVLFLYESISNVIYLSLVGIFNDSVYLMGNASLLFSALFFFLAMKFVSYVIAAMIITLLDALAVRMFGYWLAQFEPSKWGTPQDSMPFENEYVEAATNATPVSPQAGEQIGQTGQAESAQPGAQTVQAGQAESVQPGAQVGQAGQAESVQPGAQVGQAENAQAQTQAGKAGQVGDAQVEQVGEVQGSQPAGKQETQSAAEQSAQPTATGGEQPAVPQTQQSEQTQSEQPAVPKPAATGSAQPAASQSSQNPQPAVPKPAAPQGQPEQTENAQVKQAESAASAGQPATPKPVATKQDSSETK